MKKATNNQQKKEFLMVKRQAVSLTEKELIKIEYLHPDSNTPIVFKSVANDIEICDWLEDNQRLISEELNKHGAILLRGFNLDTASAFEKVCITVCPSLFHKNGEHPREAISGNVYTPVFYPADQKLLWHNENSFNHSWPQKIFFGCHRPAKRGGETPIVDSRKVFELIDSKIRDRFIEKNVMYLRNYNYGLGLDWQTVFQTKNKAEVEAVCRKGFIDFEWKNDGGLRTRSVRPAVVKHPKTGELTWFTQAQHWHISCLNLETREALTSSFCEEDLPRNCYYGDGSTIEDSIMEEICGVYQQLEVSFPWQTGDLLILDNLLIAHARNPYIGERKLFVAMGEMTSFHDI
ncbi:putative taurine catabolism dioxygenase [Cylindrospermum stagnale PCC 7417]|uniref:Putative taurine catabolism dioxygenase n=1 Tax=Cylindrospermum stagnale PCC 7417 TaxID=56107 RepID=K9WWA2_9NOST|nr:TauD/TfdA family dioxygenase [Cylindrospermum stagnale]AFZ23807.1 putative taurine catabolism dioxygenase [Cylindrospermum stagnale PCC 7417]